MTGRGRRSLRERENVGSNVWGEGLWVWDPGSLFTCPGKERCAHLGFSKAPKNCILQQWKTEAQPQPCACCQPLGRAALHMLLALLTYGRLSRFKSGNIKSWGRMQLWQQQSHLNSSRLNTVLDSTAAFPWFMGTLINSGWFWWREITIARTLKCLLNKAHCTWRKTKGWLVTE